MKTSLEKADQIMESLISQLTIIDDTLKQANPERLRVLIEKAEIESLGNRLENKNRSCTQLTNSINRIIQRSLK